MICVCASRLLTCYFIFTKHIISTLFGQSWSWRTLDISCARAPNEMLHKVFIKTSSNNPISRKALMPTSYQSGWRNVSFCLLCMTKSCCGCFSLLSSLLMANLLGYFLPWFAASNVVSGHWQKLCVDHRLPRGERGRCFIVMDPTLEWKCPVHIWWRGSHYTVLLLSNLEKSPGRCTLCASSLLWRVTVTANLWMRTYIAGVRKLIHHYDAYNLYRYIPSIPGTGYGKEFYDVRDERSSLGQGVFKWLVNIQPSYLVYRYGDICYPKSYIPSRSLVSLDMTSFT